MSRPILLDLFCKAGGASTGYHRAGFDVVGVDRAPQPNYPFAFVQADAIEYGYEHGRLFHAVAASPPCQAHTRARVLNKRTHPDLIAPTRAMLASLAVPYVIENVVGAPLLDPIQMCGTAFGLRVDCCDGIKRELRRHRLFESNVALTGVACDHQHPAISVFGNGGPRRNRQPDSRAAYEGPIAERRAAMGINWTNRNELSEAIPPAYTHHIGGQLLAHVMTGVAA